MNQESVQAFCQARSRRPDWVGIDGPLRPATAEEGYRLLHAIHAQLAAAGDARVGWKVGCTSAAGQRSFGLSEPVYAGLFAGARSASLADALQQPLRRPSLECEIAVVLRRDLDGTDPHLPIAAAAEAIGACHIGCEIIDNRYGDPMTVGVPSLIADDFFQAGFVLGPGNPDWCTQDLATVDAFIEIDGDRVTGSPGSVLSPCESLLWLAQALARNGVTLRAGEIVLTGSITVPTPISLPARTVTMGITGFTPLRLG